MEQERASEDEEITPTQTPVPMEEDLILAEEAAMATESGPACGSGGADGGTTEEEDETKAAVCLQSNFRGHKERKKYKERRKTLAGQELAMNPEPCSTDDYEPELVAMQEEEEQIEQAEPEGENQEGVEGEPDPEQEAKAATVLQSNFRGHKERQRLEKEGKIPKKGKGVPEEHEEPFPEPPPVDKATELQEACEEVIVEQEQDAAEGTGEEDEERAATVLQSNFRGHKERKKLQEEGKIPNKKEKTTCEPSPEPLAEEPLPDPTQPASEPKTESELEVELETECVRESGQEPDVEQPCSSQPDIDEEKAATVLQSNFRGHRERKKLKEKRGETQQEKGCETNMEEEEENTEECEEVEGEVLEITDIHVEHRTCVSQQDELHEEEQAAVKIQSTFRGHKDRKNLKAATEREAEELEDFSTQVTLHEPIVFQTRLHILNPNLGDYRYGNTLAWALPFKVMDGGQGHRRVIRRT